MVRTWSFVVSLVLALGYAGFVQADTEPISQAELLGKLDDESAPLVLDVRSAGEYAAGHVPGAKNVPVQELSGALPALLDAAAAGQREVVVYCERGGRAARAEALLREAGFETVLHLEGDMAAWRAASLPTAKPDDPAE
jgi:phage shock protein E